MKLLIITQSVDIHHPILGFFHRWIEEFAKHCESIQVICLEEGTHSLPANVTVHSLGKEAGVGKIGRLLRFYSLVWSLRRKYDSVFVHMNQLYVLLGASFWRLGGKKITLWYAHGTVSKTLVWAEKMVDTIVTCSADSFKLSSKKVVVTGHGIDTDRFAPAALTRDIDCITVGRITESKQLIPLIRLFKKISATRQISLTIGGVAVTKKEKAYEEALRKILQEEKMQDRVTLVGKISQTDLPAFLNRSKVFVTVAANASLDKAMLEAMACGVPIVSMAPGSRSLPLGGGQVSTNERYIEEVIKVIESGVFVRPEYVTYVRDNHSLAGLIPRIIKTLS